DQGRPQLGQSPVTRFVVEVGGQVPRLVLRGADQQKAPGVVSGTAQAACQAGSSLDPAAAGQSCSQPLDCGGVHVPRLAGQPETGSGHQAQPEQPTQQYQGRQPDQQL